MCMDSILQYPNEILQTKCKDVEVFDDSLKDFVLHLSNMAYKYNALGIASPQIGVSHRVIFIRHPSFAGEMINPVVIDFSNETKFIGEECLSVDDSYMVFRRLWIKVEWYDRWHIKRTSIFQDGVARVIQHEIDHLDGICISDIGVIMDV